MNTETFKEFINKYQWHILISCIAITFVVQLISDLDSDAQIISSNPVELDTIIPKNHSLFPLNLVNRKSVSAVLGPFGVVDLYRYYNEKQKVIIARNIKLFRAPKDPESFYVLVPESKADVFIRENDKTFAVIKNRQQKQFRIGTSNKKKKRNISIGVNE